jgi:hypothetical protein
MVKGATSTTDFSGVDFTGAGYTVPLARIAAIFSGTGSFLSLGTSNNYASGITSEALTIDPNGKIGIGTSTPSVKLHVSGSSVPSLISSSDNSLVLNLRGAGDGTGVYIGSSSGTMLLANSSGSPIIYVNSNNNVGIGVATPSYQLQLSTDSAGKLSTNTWTITSDERIKENIELANLDICYDVVKNLPLKIYNWKYYTKEQAPDNRMLGWIAQDVKQYFPKAVQEHQFKINEDETIDDCLSLNADQINKALYGTVQKLQTIVESQQAIINNLLSRLEALEAK